MQTTSGAYACTGMIAGFGIIGFRDPNGIRPMGWARRKSEQIEGGWDYLMASESVVCDALGFGEWKDVNPGKFPTSFLTVPVLIYFRDRNDRRNDYYYSRRCQNSTMCTSSRLCSRYFRIRLLLATRFSTRWNLSLSISNGDGRRSCDKC